MAGVFRRTRQVLDKADRALNQAQYDLDLLAAIALDVLDGFTIHFVRVKEVSIWDFIRGKCDKLPIQLRFELKEDDELP